VTATKTPSSTKEPTKTPRRKRKAHRLPSPQWHHYNRADGLIEPSPFIEDLATDFEALVPLFDVAAIRDMSDADRSKKLRRLLAVAKEELPKGEYRRLVAELRTIFDWLPWKPIESKDEFPLEIPALGRGNVETPGVSGAKDEGILNKSLSALLTSWGVPKQMHREMAVKLERTAREDAKAALRPKWEERGEYAELKDLSAPQFLKRVYADEIAHDGSIKKAVVRSTDPALMSIVEAYISGREARGRDMGDAKGLRFVTSNAGRPKRADVG
jgi:hypothetical protein